MSKECRFAVLGLLFRFTLTAAPAVQRYLSASHWLLPTSPFTTMAHFDRSRLPHEVPDWIDPTQEAFFITINCLPRGKNQLANVMTWTAILETLEFREKRGDWKWRIVLAMPDHLHGIVVFPERFFMKKCVADWKRWLASKYSIVWQDGFFDHRLRSVESAKEKADYIRINPVRAGLVEQAVDWPYMRDWRPNE